MNFLELNLPGENPCIVPVDGISNIMLQPAKESQPALLVISFRHGPKTSISVKGDTAVTLYKKLQSLLKPEQLS